MLGLYCIKFLIIKVFVSATISVAAASFCPCNLDNGAGTLIWGKFKCSAPLGVEHLSVNTSNPDLNLLIPLFCRRNSAQCINSTLCSGHWSVWTSIHDCNSTCSSGMTLWKRECQQVPQRKRSQVECPLEDATESCRNEVCENENDIEIHEVTVSLREMIYPTSVSLFDDKMTTNWNKNHSNDNGNTAVSNEKQGSLFNVTSSPIQEIETDTKESSGSGEATVKSSSYYDKSRVTSPNSVKIVTTNQPGNYSEQKSIPSLETTETNNNIITSITVKVILGITGALGWLCFITAVVYFVKFRKKRKWNSASGILRRGESGVYERVGPALPPPRLPSFDALTKVSQHVTNHTDVPCTDDATYVEPATIRSNHRSITSSHKSRDTTGEVHFYHENCTATFFRRHSDFHKPGYLTPLHLCPAKSNDPGYISFSPVILENETKHNNKKEVGRTGSSTNSKRLSTVIVEDTQEYSTETNLKRQESNQAVKERSYELSKSVEKRLKSVKNTNNKENKESIKKIRKGCLKSKYGVNLKLNMAKAKESSCNNTQEFGGKAYTS